MICKQERWGTPYDRSPIYQRNKHSHSFTARGHLGASRSNLDVGGNQATWRKPKQAQEEPVYSEATVIIAAPPHIYIFLGIIFLVP